MSTEVKLNKVTTAVLQAMKRKGEKITMLTAYDYPMAAALDEAGVDILLVGDSLGMVVLGLRQHPAGDYGRHGPPHEGRREGHKAGLGHQRLALHVLPASVEEAVRNAGRLLQEAGAHGVKLEGGREVAEATRRIVAAGIPVMAHLGLTPQSIHQFGGYKVQGKEDAAARRIVEDAKILEEAGAFSVVLECVPASLAEAITKSLSIPTIGIGGGVHCDGQVLVVHDMLGMFERFTPKFVKKYANLNAQIKDAVRQYVEEVRTGVFPGKEHSY